MMRPCTDDGITLSESDSDEDEISLSLSDSDEEIICTHLTTSLNPVGAGSSSKPQKDESPSSSEKSETQANENEVGNTNEGLENAKTVLATAGIATTSAVAGTAAATAGLTAVGFTGTGVAAGSIAAGIQASIGSVAAGSTFAGLQALGATGGFAVLGPVGLVAGAVGGGIFLGVTLYKSSKRKNKNQTPSTQNGRKPDDNENKGQHDITKSAETPLIRGINICDDCWRRMQIKEYEKFAKRNKKDTSLL